jgi:hypothetical protein
MKILNIHKTITPVELLNVLREKLNPLFSQQRNEDIKFTCEIKDGVIEISQPELYEKLLFSITIKGQELLITRTADYIDDVNALTIESILNEIFAGLAAEGKVTLVLEG